MSTSQLLIYPVRIDISANATSDISLNDVVTSHIVTIDVSAADVSGVFIWTRGTSGSAPTASTNATLLEALFTKVAAAVESAVDSNAVTGGLDFTVANMNPAFRGATPTANAFVLPYVLNELFGSSDVSDARYNPYAAQLTTGDPMISSANWVAAYKDTIGANSTATTDLFNFLVTQKPERFTDVSAAIFSATPPDAEVSGLWPLQVDDKIQFDTGYTFAHKIEYNPGATAANYNGTQKLIPAGRSFVVRLRLIIK